MITHVISLYNKNFYNLEDNLFNMTASLSNSPLMNTDFSINLIIMTFFLS